MSSFIFSRACRAWLDDAQSDFSADQGQCKTGHIDADHLGSNAARPIG